METESEVEVEAIQPKSLVPGPDTFLQIAVNRGAEIEELKILMDLRDRDERWKAEREFEKHFAEMQKDYTAALKTKEVKTKAGTLAYKYCPLPEILKIYAPILSRHGFSYRWEEVEDKDKAGKTTTCFLTGHGFSRTANEHLPYALGNALINEIQTRGVTSEYGRRYSFMNVTGCIVADEQDSDAVLSPPNSQAIKKTIAACLPFLPTGLRNEYIEKMESTDTDELTRVESEVAGLRKRCQALIATGAKKDDETKQRIIDGLKKIRDIDELIDWESYVEGL